MVNVSIAINKETRLQTETVRVVCMLNVSYFWYMLFKSLFFTNCKINNLKKKSLVKIINLCLTYVWSIPERDLYNIWSFN